MKIIHVCLSCFYIDGYNYQENELVRQHVIDGHDVLVLASTENYGSNRMLTYVEPNTYMGTDGAMVRRIPYAKFLPQVIMRKLRIHGQVYSFLKKEKPDVIMFHGLCGWELLTVSKYKLKNPDVKFYVDSHTDSNNSASGFISRKFLHGMYYRLIIKKSLRSIEKVLCVSLEVQKMANELYKIPNAKLEFYPLGGNVFDDVEYNLRRARARHELGLLNDDVIFLQTGKIGTKKKLLDSLKAFKQTYSQKLIFLIAGSLHEEIEKEAYKLIESDLRIRLLGWKSTLEMQDLFCAADVYVQPGSQSASMQMSLCARCPVILDDVFSHKPYVNGNGWLIQNTDEMVDIFKDIEIGKYDLKEFSQRSLEISSNFLDYKKLARRVLM